MSGHQHATSAAALAKAFGAPQRSPKKAPAPRKPQQQSAATATATLAPSNRPRIQQLAAGPMLQGAASSLANLAQLGAGLLPGASMDASSRLVSARPLNQAPPKTAAKRAAPTKPATNKQQKQQKFTYNPVAAPAPNRGQPSFDWLAAHQLSHQLPPISGKQSGKPPPPPKPNTNRNNKRSSTSNNNRRGGGGGASNKLPPPPLSHPATNSSLSSAPAAAGICNQPLQFNDLHVIPVSEGLSLSLNVAVAGLQQKLSNNSQSHQPPPPPAASGSGYPTATTNYAPRNPDRAMMNNANNPYVDIEGDSNNISLIKLMAILNNPALTITPVANPPPPPAAPLSSTNNNSHHHLNSINLSAMNSSYSSQATLSVLDDQRSVNSYYDDTFPRGELNKPANLSLNGRISRVPQSAANLQQLFESNNTVKNCNNNNRMLDTTTLTMANNQSCQLSDFIASQQSAGWVLDSSLGGQSCSSSYDQLSSNISRGLLGKTFQQYDGSSLDNDADVDDDDDDDSFSRDHLEDPLMVSDSNKNPTMQEPKDDFNQSSVSVQLLKHIADQTKDNNVEWKPTHDREQESIVEPECIVGIPANLQNLNWAAKKVEKIITVSSDFKPMKTPKQQLKPSPTRLYTPSKVNERPVDLGVDELNISPIKIETLAEKEVYVSEYHDMLDRLMSNTPTRKFTGAMPEPDEIFINRSKRVMSRIDVMLERKKRRRFERIMSKSEPKTASLEAQCAESEDEWSEDEEDLEFTTVIKTQLPLSEPETIQKRDHLLGVGLVSRDTRNQILVDQCENRLQILSPLVVEGAKCEVSQNVKRLVDTLIKTDGVNVDMRVNSDIKRNDVPILEGLNRNTSRLKMNYMSTIGLEKRSKRTTLYKIKQYINTTPKTSPGKIKSPLQSKSKVEPTPEKSPTPAETTMAAVNNGFTSGNLVFTTCGEALQAPNKNEYMKSLGLMVS